MEIKQLLKSKIREVPDWPKKGVSFKDITPRHAFEILRICQSLGSEKGGRPDYSWRFGYGHQKRRKDFCQGVSG